MKKKQRKIIIWLTIFAISATSIFGIYQYKEYKRRALYEDTIDFFYEHREEFEKAIEHCNEIDVSGISADYDSSSSYRIEKCDNYYIYFKKGADNTESNQAIEELSKLLRLFSENKLIFLISYNNSNQEKVNCYEFFYKGFFKYTTVYVLYTGYPSTSSVKNGKIEPDRLTVLDDDWVIFEKERDNNP